MTVATETAKDVKYGFEAELRRLADLLRSARLNQLYYGQCLQRYRTRSKWLDGLLALGTSGAVASWALWSTPIGALAWQILAAVVALVTVLRPLFDFPRRIERYSGLFGRYTDLYYELRGLHADVRQTGRFDDSVRRVLDRAEAKYRALAPEDDPSYSIEKVASLTERVNKELPKEYLWITSE